MKGGRKLSRFFALSQKSLNILSKILFILFQSIPDLIITKTRLFKYIENFTTQKREIFQLKNANIFLISAQNIDCGYSLELPRQGSSNEYPQSMFWVEIRKIMYIPVNPSFII